MSEPANSGSVGQIASGVLTDHPPTETLNLEIGDWKVRVESNSSELIKRLARYFRHFHGGTADPDCVIKAIEMEEPDLGLVFEDWKRDPGKVGRKDTYADLEDGRVCRKFRTGMQFLMAGPTKIALGPCLANDNQVINFINSQYITWKLRQKHVLCHAAAVVRGGRGIAMAGFSGGGKSTLALHLMSRGLDFVSNDRLLARRDEGRTVISGVPKLPRINPGTALNNPNLRGILSPERRRALAQLATSQLWELEEKYDVEIDEVFPGARFEIQAELDSFMILNWKRDVREATRIEQVDLDQRRDLLAAVMKSPGPFYEHEDGTWPRQMMKLDETPYLAHLNGVAIFELAGRVDFDAAVEFCMARIESTETSPMPPK
jgi:HprK-related kinase B